MSEPVEVETVKLDGAEDLAALRVAKLLFVSDWYAEAAETLFEEGDRAALERVRDETSAEIEDLVAVAHRWSRAASRPARATRDLPRMTRDDFLQLLIESKRAAGELLERVASEAPARDRMELLALAATDFRHAAALGTLLRENGS